MRPAGKTVVLAFVLKDRREEESSLRNKGSVQSLHELAMPHSRAVNLWESHNSIVNLVGKI